jgi:hypothetical protein
MFATETNATIKVSEIINLEAFADMLSDSVIIEKLDLGAVIVLKVRHSQRGNMVLVNSTGDRNAIVYM